MFLRTSLIFYALEVCLNWFKTKIIFVLKHLPEKV